MDELFILSSHDDEHSLYHSFTRDLTAAWDVEDEGEVSDLLSIEITAKDSHVSLTQKTYIEKLMVAYGPTSVSPPSSQISPSLLHSMRAHPRPVRLRRARAGNWRH